MSIVRTLPFIKQCPLTGAFYDTRLIKKEYAVISVDNKMCAIFPTRKLACLYMIAHKGQYYIQEVN